MILTMLRWCWICSLTPRPTRQLALRVWAALQVHSLKVDQTNSHRASVLWTDQFTTDQHLVTAALRAWAMWCTRRKVRSDSSSVTAVVTRVNFRADTVGEDESRHCQPHHAQTAAGLRSHSPACYLWQNCKHVRTDLSRVQYVVRAAIIRSILTRH